MGEWARFGTLVLALLPHAQAQAMNRAIARMRGASAEFTQVSGYVLFEQPADDPLADVTVHVQVMGLTPGQHGFHVHQYGDVRYTDSLTTMGAHFVPNCVPPDMQVDDDGNLIVSDNDCAKDARHGLPPSVERQPGDMGNILIQSDGTPDAATSILTIGQQKMSLSDSLRSIVGRTVVVHRNADDGSQPYGNAGTPEAYGVIGLASTAQGALNRAMAPSVPHVTKIMCTFEPPAGEVIDGVASSATFISGQVLLSLLEPHRPGVARLQAELSGLSAGSRHSFHFHEWGDMTVNMNDGSLGAIYSTNAISLDAIQVNAKGIGVLDLEFRSAGLHFDGRSASGSGLQQHVGRSLTIHEGESQSSRTIAAAACGIAHPHAVMSEEFLGKASALLSPGAIFLCVLTSLTFAAMLCVATLYYLRYPIPCCGQWLYQGSYDEMPPPPPPAHGGVPITNKV